MKTNGKFLLLGLSTACSLLLPIGCAYDEGDHDDDDGHGHVHRQVVERSVAPSPHVRTTTVEETRVIRPY